MDILWCCGSSPAFWEITIVGPGAAHVPALTKWILTKWILTIFIEKIKMI